MSFIDRSYYDVRSYEEGALIINKPFTFVYLFFEQVGAISNFAYMSKVYNKKR
jgi:hypothetical protein